jgi:hypothetical protein
MAMRGLLFTRVEVTARESVPPNNRMNWHMAMTTDMLRFGTLAWTAMVVVSVEIYGQSSSFLGDAAYASSEKQGQKISQGKTWENQTCPDPEPATTI